MTESRARVVATRLAPRPFPRRAWRDPAEPAEAPKRLVSLLRRERRMHFGERLGGWRAHIVCGGIARCDGSRADDRAAPDSDIAEDHTTRTDVHLILDLDRRRVLGRPLGPPIEVGEDRRPHADRAVVADRSGVGMRRRVEPAVRSKLAPIRTPRMRWSAGRTLPPPGATYAICCSSL